MSQTSDAEGLSVGIPSAHFITIHMPADELVARLSLDLGQLELLVGVGIQVIEVDNFLTVIVGEDTLLVVGGDGNGNGLLHFRLGLNFLELSLDGGIALIGAILIEAQAGNTEGLSIGTPSDFRSALALPANELVAFLGGNGGNVVLLAANFLLVALEDNRACTVIGERTLVRGNGEVHSEVMLLGLGLLLFLKLSSKDDVTIGAAFLIISPASNELLFTAGICIELSLEVAGPTSELVAIDSLDYRNGNRCTVNILDRIGHGVFILGAYQSAVVVSVKGNISGLLNGLGLFLVSLKGVADISLIIPVARSPAIHLGPHHNGFASQLRGAFGISNPLTAFNLRGILRNRIFYQNNILGLVVFRKANDNLFTRSRIGRRCKRCKRHAHDNHEHGSQQSQQTSFEVRFLHVNFSYSLKFI